MSLNSWFSKGMTFAEYVGSMQVNQDELQRIYNDVEISIEDAEYFSQLKDKNLRIITLTADWCGDAALCVPIMQRIAELASIKTRFLIRDDNLELMDQYLTNGKSRSIPIFVFTDENGKEQMKWGPRAPVVQQWVNENIAKLPPKDNPDFTEKQKEMFADFKRTITTNTFYWESVIKDIRQGFEERIV